MVKAVTYIQDGKNLDFLNTTGADIAYLDIITFANTDKIFIAGEAILQNKLGTVYSEGVFELPAKAEAFSFGDTVYWDTANGYLTKTAKGNICVGYITEAKLQATTTASVKLVAGLSSVKRVYSKIFIPVESLAGLTNGVKVVDALPFGFIGRIEAIDFVTGVNPATTAGKDASLSAKIGAEAVTGGALALTTVACNAAGKLLAGTAITAKNEFVATDTLTIVAGNPSAVFAEGNGKIIVTVSQVLQ